MSKALKDLQHDGGEDFDQIGAKRRKNPAEFEDDFEESEEAEERRKHIEQEEYLNFNNPALWNGEI